MTLFYDDFEQPRLGWFFAGNGGFDYGKGLAHKGANNAWVRASSGWNAINRFHPVPQRSECSVAAWLRLSDTLTDGYFSVRGAPQLNGDGPIITEQKLVGPGRANPANGNYNKYLLRFNSAGYSRILIYVGLWGVGRDAWIQIDGLEIRDPSVRIDEGTALNPV